MQQRRPAESRFGPEHAESYPEPVTAPPDPWPDSFPPASDGDNQNNAALANEMEGVYIISVAARLLEMHPQTLRKYERLGLVRPVRTVGMLRLYSQDDLRKIMLIRHLTDNLGLNLAGVEFVLKLVNNLDVFTSRVARAAGNDAIAERIREEVVSLCDSLSLPAPRRATSSNPDGNT